MAQIINRIFCGKYAPATEKLEENQFVFPGRRSVRPGIIKKESKMSICCLLRIVCVGMNM